MIGRRVGLLALGLGFALLALGGCLSLGLKAELARPGVQLVGAVRFNEAMSMHAVVSLLGLWLVGLGLGLWRLALAGPLRWVALAGLPLVAGGAAVATAGTYGTASSSATGWTAYAPLASEEVVAGTRSIRLGLAVAFAGLALVGAALVVGVLRGRRLSPLGSSAAAGGALVALPLASSLGALVGERDLPFPAHVGWFAVLLPFLGAAAEVTEAAAGRKISSLFHVAVWATAVVGVASWILDAVAAGPEPTLVPLLMGTPVAVASTAILLLLPAVRGGATPALLFVVASLLQLAIGLLLGVLAATGSARHLGDTQFAVAHLHYSLLGGALLAFFAAVFHANRRLDRRLAYVQLALLLVGTNALLAPLVAAGWGGMPRRVLDYAPQYGTSMGVAAVGAALSAAGIAVFLVSLLSSLGRGEPDAGPLRGGGRGGPPRARSAGGS